MDIKVKNYIWFTCRQNFPLKCQQKIPIHFQFWSNNKTTILKAKGKSRKEPSIANIQSTPYTYVLYLHSQIKCKCCRTEVILQEGASQPVHPVPAHIRYYIYLRTYMCILSHINMRGNPSLYTVAYLPYTYVSVLYEISEQGYP